MRRLREADISRIVAALKPETVPEPDSWLETAEHRRLIVHTKKGESIEGTLRHAADDGVVLWAAKLLRSDGVPLAGEVWIPREEVLFVQTVRM